MNGTLFFSLSAAIVVAGFSADVIERLSGIIAAALQVPGL